MARYAIWDKKSPVITHKGTIYTAAQWMKKFPVAAMESVTVICSAGEINGGCFYTLGQLRKQWEDRGVDFSACTTDEEVLAAIEAAMDAQQAAAAEAAAQPTSEERIAAALEAQNLMAMEDITE